MSKSIVQPQVKECLLCRRESEETGYYGPLPAAGLHRHHIMFGTANRKLSEKFGLWCWLCPDHHEHGPAAVHRNRETDLYLKRLAQERFEELMSHDDWMRIFGRNYIETTKKEPKIETKGEGFYFIEGEL